MEFLKCSFVSTQRGGLTNPLQKVPIFPTHVVPIFCGRQADIHIFSTHVVLSFRDRQTYF